MKVDEFESMVLNGINLVGEDKFDEAISISKDALAFKVCDEDPSARIWPAGTIVAAYGFKYLNVGSQLNPGSVAYEDLKKYTKIVLDAFDALDVEEQENYKRSNPKLFPLLRPIFETTQAGETLNKPQEPSPNKSGCFIATAVYGSVSAPEVTVLREFRDTILLRSYLGRVFVRVYYATSPPLARFLQTLSPAKTALRKLLLNPIVRFAGRCMSR
jgi:hypothetical protein